MSKKENAETKLDDGTLEREIYRAMRAEGWLAPETIPEVLAAEKSLENHQVDVSDTSFERLRARLRRSGTGQLVQMKAPRTVPSDFSANLARAAREGGELSPEIELAMKRDRDAAELEKGDK
jgi:hypothetical protein